MRKRVFVFAGGVAVFASSVVAFGKADAKDAWKFVENVEAVVAAVDVSEAPGDADLNIILRPLGPNEKSQFPHVPNKQTLLGALWRPGDPEDNEWLKRIWASLKVWTESPDKNKMDSVIDHTYVRDLGPQDFSEACRSCAKDDVMCKPPEEYCESEYVHKVEKMSYWEWLICWVLAPAECALKVATEEIADALSILPCGYALQGEFGVGGTHVYQIYARPKPADKHPCPQLWSCRDCVRDIKDRSAFGASYLLPKAELFVGHAGCNDPWSCNDLNPTMRDVLAAYGIVSSDWNYDVKSYTDNGIAVLCSEFNNMPGSICGKHILISGWANEDNEHARRLEIHPVSTIVLQKEPGTFIVGAFIDGSFETPAHWTQSYRKAFGAKYPSSVVFDLKGLQGSPNEQFEQLNADGGKAPLVVSGTCEVKPLVTLNAKATAGTEIPKDSLGRALCRSWKVDLKHEYKDPLPPPLEHPGAAWVAEVKAGWKFENVDFKILSANLETPHGVITGQPPEKGPDKNKCEAPPPLSPGEKPPTGADKLWRWYKWRLKTLGQWPASAAVDWVWNTKPLDVKVEKNSKVVNGTETEVTVWMPVRDEAPASGEYTADIEVLLAASHLENAIDGAGVLARDTTTLKVPTPKAQILVSKAEIMKEKPLKGLNYQFSYEAGGLSGFCGVEKNLVFEWRRKVGEKGVTVLQKGKGPFPWMISTGGETIDLSLTVKDPWEVQQVVANPVTIVAPDLALSLEESCAPGKEAVEVGNPPGGWSGADEWVKPLKPKACKEIVLFASVKETKGSGAKFAMAGLQGLKIEWIVEYSTSQSKGVWAQLPSAWRGKTTKKKYANDLYVIKNETGKRMYVRATAMASDKWGRSSDNAIAAGGEYDYVDKATIAQYAKDFWIWAAGNVPMPIADPCGLKCAGVSPMSDSWLGHEVSRLLWALDYKKNRPQEEMRAFVSSVRAFSSLAADRVAKKRGLTRKSSGDPARWAMQANAWRGRWKDLTRSAASYDHGTRKWKVDKLSPKVKAEKLLKFLRDTPKSGRSGTSPSGKGPKATPGRAAPLPR